VTNRTFTKALARALHRPAIFAAPRALLGLALGETASVVLASQRVVPERALETGYRFRYPSLARALDDLVGPRKASAPAEVRP
jgi:NAD dependent epimerase/dehydratase family enzyme